MLTLMRDRKFNASEIGTDGETDFLVLSFKTKKPY